MTFGKVLVQPDGGQHATHAALGTRSQIPPEPDGNCDRRNDRRDAHEKLRE